MRKFLAGILFLIALLLLYLLFWPVAIDPADWQAPAADVSELYPPNTLLAGIERLEITGGYGPEDVAVDSAGQIYGGLQDGRIIRMSPESGAAQVFADTKGRPLGLHFDSGGNLIVADAYKGLLSVDPRGQISVLATEANGLPFKLTDDVDIAADGSIYFSDASSKFGQGEYRLDALEHRPHGRLLVYHPVEKTTRVLLDNLYFANGVAVSPDQTFVLVNETWKYRVKRYWLAGERAGQSDIFIDNLPGFPDGISSNYRDAFWLALASPRNPRIDNLADKPFLRKVVARLPGFFQPDAIPYAFVLGLDTHGKVVHNLQEPSGKPFSFITSVQQHKDMLYLGSLIEPAIGRMKAPGRLE
jgi:sugar lactone lactonase YvrE